MMRYVALIVYVDFAPETFMKPRGLRRPDDLLRRC
jgi:hypothetical protein